MNSLKCFFWLALLLVGTSCKKYLDKKSDKMLVTPTTLQDLQGLFDDRRLMNEDLTPQLGEISADDYFLSEDLYNASLEDEQYLYTWQRYNMFYPVDWSNSYLPVYNANVCLERLEKITSTIANKVDRDRVAGTAHFFRAHSYLWLLWNYARAFDDQTADTDPGIVLRQSSDLYVPSKRSTVRRCYQQVLDDAKIAASLLPDHPLHCLRPSKAAAYGLLARAYLSMRIYDSAGFYADKCLALQNALMNYNDLNLANYYPLPKFNTETIFYTEMSYSFLSSGQSLADTLLYADYDANDLRKPAFYDDMGNGYHVFNGSYSASYVYFTGIATDELYLVSAECEARSGHIAAAMDRLNQLSQNRYQPGFIPFTATDAADALNIILRERRKELTMRGLRWMDIKRLNKEGANIVLTRHVAGADYTLLPNDNYYALPLPADIVQLTGIPQNE